MIYADNVLTTVAASITISDTAISVNNVASPFAPPPDPQGGQASIVLVDSLTLPTKFERIIYTGRTGTGPFTLTGCVRTAPQAWPVGTKVFQSISADDMLSEALPAKNVLVSADIIPVQDSQSRFAPKKTTLDNILTYLTPAISSMISTAVAGVGGGGGGGTVVFDLSMILEDSLLVPKMHTSVVPKVAAFPSRTPSDQAIPAMMVRMTDNTLRGWGSTFKGLLANNYKTTDKLVALASSPIFNVPLSAGEYVIDHVMTQSSLWVLTNNGVVYSSGDNSVGQLGHGDTADRTILTRVEYFVTQGIFVTQIYASGADSTDTAATNFTRSSFWALDASGKAWACGYNAYGQLSVGNTTATISTPTQVLKSGGTPLQGIQKIYTSGTVANNVIFRVTDGAIVNGVYGAGANSSSCLGSVSTNISSATRIGTLANIVDVAMTGSDGTTPHAHTLLLSSTGAGNGDVLSCGYNVSGQCGSGDTATKTAFTAITGISNANIIKIGTSGGSNGFSWAYSGTGILYTWGFNIQGACGNNATTNKLTPAQVVGWSSNSAVAPPFEGKIQKVASYRHSDTDQAVVVLDTDGKMWFTGKDTCFLTDSVGTTVCKLFTPVLLPPLEASGEKIVDIMLHGFNNEYRLFAISSEKKLYAVGENSYGMCTGGVNGTTSTTPSYVKSLTRVRF